MPDENLMTDITPENITQANQLLTFLVSKADTDYAKVMSNTLNDKEMEINSKSIEEKLAEFELTKPYGAVVGGTGIAKEQAGLPGEEGQRAIRLLKTGGRLLQCGRGRGKCLVILDKSPLDIKKMPAAAAPVERKPRARKATKTEVVATLAASRADGAQEKGVSDLSDLPVEDILKLARDKHREMRRELEELRAESKKQARTIEELETTLDSRDVTIAALEKQLSETKVASWQ